MFKRKAFSKKNKRINRRKDSSKGRLKIKDTHVGTKFLDAYFSPAIKMKKHYNGVNSALFHSNIDTNAYATSTDAKVKLYAVSGDCMSQSALEGRQVYMEFMHFPQLAITDTGATTSNVSQLDCLGTSIGQMMDKAFLFSNAHKQMSNNFQVGDQFTAGTDQYIFTNIMKNGGSKDEAATYDADQSKLRQTTFHYEGGYHLHEFMNPTNLPIYIELIEYKPRHLMSYSFSSFDSDDGTEIVVARIPGLYESIHQDLCDQKAWDYNQGVPSGTANGSNILSGSLTGAADNTKFDKLFNELDDKGFKVGGKMAMTNMRWVILNKVNVRIDPGNVYKYTVEHKPFSFTPAQLMQYNNHYRMHNTTDATSYSRFIQPVEYGFNPLFSRGISVRATGSKAFINNSTNSAQKNSYGIDYSGGEMVNNIQPNTKNDKTGHVSHAIAALVTHAPVLTHNCTESHKFRMRVKYDNNIKFYTDYRPNAGSQNDIVITDKVQFLNQETNNVENLDYTEFN